MLVVVITSNRRPSMLELKLIAIDTSKRVFTLHGVDDRGNVLLRRELRRSQVEAFFRKQLPVDIVLEACGASHHWGRVLTALGHRVRLIAPQYVKAFVKRHKNDRIDAQAICEAAQRPWMRFVPVKSAEAQADAMILTVRELLVKQQTQLMNALRGHAAEFGVIAAKGTSHIEALLEQVAADPAVPAAAREMMAELGAAIEQVSTRIAALDRKLAAMHKANPVSQLLVAVPGIGPVSALTLALTVDASQFQSGRHFAAWLGLVPKQNSTGGKPRLGGISREGNERLRQLLVLGATSVVRRVEPDKGKGSAWLQALVRRRPRMVVAVALANKMARVVWAMMTSGEAYRPTPAAG
jgi:transposase